MAKPGSISFTGAWLDVADLDGNGKPDLAGTSGTNAVLAVANSSSTFTSVSVAMGVATLGAIRAADLDGDGRRDLVVVTEAPALVVRRGIPGLAFGFPSEVALPGRARGLALGDLNGDGRPDAVTALLEAGQVAVSLNDGVGTLGPPLLLDSGRSWTEPVIGDFTGDGHADIALAVYEPQHAIHLFRGHGDGTFDPAVTALLSSSYRDALAAADFDRDGDLDLGAAGNEDVAIYSNEGAGTFREHPLAPGVLEYFRPSGGRVVAADFDRDGWTDFAVAGDAGVGFDRSNNYLAVFPNRAGAVTGPALHWRVGIFPRDAAAADFDGDGWLEGITTCASAAEQGGVTKPMSVGAAFLLKNAGEAGLVSLLEVFEPVWLPARPGANALPDLWGGHEGRLYRARNLGHGIFGPATVVGRGEPLAARDLDGDGDEDLLIASGDSIWVQSNLGDAGLGEPRAILPGHTLLDFADFDRDGRLDLFVRDAGHRIRVLRSDGNGQFGPPEDTGVDAPTKGEDDHPGAARDVNGDGFADLLFSAIQECEFESQDGKLHVDHRLALIVRRRNGADGWAAPETTVASLGENFKLTGGRGPLRFGDWNGDGRLDVACSTRDCTTGNPSWFAAFLGDPGGHFTALPGFRGGPSMCDLATGDLNRDHLDDLVRINSPIGFTFSASTLASDGFGGFSGPSFQMGEFPVLVNLADVDGDGRLDVITRNRKIPDYSRTSYSIRRNLTPVLVTTPVLVSLVSARWENGAVELDWRSATPQWFAGAIERRTPATGWVALATQASDASGRLHYRDSAVQPGERYEYRLRLLRDEAGGEVASSWITIPGATFALRGAVPSPAVGSPSLAFSIPAAGDVEMRLLDVAGRVVRRERLDGLSGGPHRVGFTGPALEPGWYVAQIEHAGRRLETPVVVIR